MSASSVEPYRYLTDALQPDDGRLKVLWIDDLEALLPDNFLDCEDYFSFIWVSGPVALKNLVEDSLSHGDGPGRAGSVYAIRGLPCDAYLTDFRLCDKKDEGCTNEEHIEIGLHAPSGGFLLGMLTALRWPEHPQCIIPYSAYDEEFGQIWRLSSAVFPPAVHVLWDKAVGKGLQDRSMLIRLIAPHYRQSLQRSLERGLVHMPFPERDRWERSVEDSTARISAHEKLWFVGEYGPRPVLAGALFFDSLEADPDPWVKADVIARWLSSVPAADPLEREARSMARWYWHLRQSDMSRVIYRVIQQKKANPALETPGNPPGFPSLFEWKKNGKGGKPGEDREVKRLVRLAFLFLLIEEHHARGRTEFGPPLSDDARKLRARIAGLLDQSPDAEPSPDPEGLYEAFLTALKGLKMRIGKDKFEKLSQELKEREKSTGKTFVEELAALVDDPYDRLTAKPNLPISDADVVRMVDPLPFEWDQVTSLDRGKKLGAAVSRLWSDDKGKDYDVHDLLNGDSSRLLPTEKLCARRYARELMPSERDWPAWLAGS